MIAIAAALIGAIIGFRRAGKLGGSRPDRLQYAASHAIAFGIAGVIIQIILIRVMKG